MRWRAAVLVVLMLNGCSFIRSQAPKPSYDPAVADPECHASYGAPTADVVFAGLSAIPLAAGIALVAIAASSVPENPPNSNFGTGALNIAVGSLGVGIFGGSAGYGFNAVPACAAATKARRIAKDEQWERAKEAMEEEARLQAAARAVEEQAALAAAEERRAKKAAADAEAERRRQAEEEARPKPDEVVDGRPVLHWALVDGEVEAVAHFTDGGWRSDPRGAAIPPSSLVLISDPKGRIVERVRTPRANYRGTEGWQGLRWGMTLPEIARAMKGTRVQPTKEEGAAWTLTVADHPARVSCLLAEGRLVSISVTFVSIDKDRFAGLLNERYGPSEGNEGWLDFDSNWQTNESEIYAHWLPLGANVVYISRAFVFQGKQRMDEYRKAKAKEL